MKIRLLLPVLALLLADPLAARPLDTDDTGTAPAGRFEVEGGFDFVRTGGAGAFGLTPVLAFGASPRLQLDLGCDYLIELGEAGAGDTHSLKPALQFKARFHEAADGRFTLALKGNVVWPEHVRGPRGDHTRHGHVRLLATRGLSVTTELDFNAGYDFTGAWGGGDDAWTAGAALRHAATDSLTWLGEIFTTVPREGAVQAMIAVGVKRAVGDWTLDGLVGTGLGSDAPELRLVLGFVRAW